MKTRISSSYNKEKRKEKYQRNKNDPVYMKSAKFQAKRWRDTSKLALATLQQKLHFQKKEIAFLNKKLVESISLLESITIEQDRCESALEEAKSIISASHSSNPNPPQINNAYQNCNHFISRILQNDFLTKELFRFSKNELIDLHQQLETHFNSLNTRGETRKKTSGHKEKLDSMQHLCITLLWLCHYPTDAVMAAIFDINSWKINRVIKRTLSSLQMALTPLISWPSDIEIEDLKLK